MRRRQVGDLPRIGVAEPLATVKVTAFCLLLSAFCLLFPVHGKRQKQIARLAHDATITRVCVEDTVSYRRAASVTRATFCEASVHRSLWLRRIVIPKHRAIFGRIGPQMPVGRAGK